MDNFEVSGVSGLEAFDDSYNEALCDFCDIIENEKNIKLEIRSQTSPKQFELLIEFMEKNGDISQPQTSDPGQRSADQLWVELTQSLNSVDGGVSRKPEKWKRVWTDWKTRTKRKAITMKKNTSNGGPSSSKPMTPLENRVLGLMSGSSKNKTTKTISKLQQIHKRIQNLIVMETKQRDRKIAELKDLQKMILNDL